MIKLGGLIDLKPINLEPTITEGFSTWEIRFTPMTINGVKLDKKPIRVKARNTVEAIRKAYYAKGGSGKDWVATETDLVKKL
jgi:hypothetical protein